jgi:magnesium transporter
MSESRIDFKDFHWLDFENPDRPRLERLAAEYHLHSTSVQDCLEPQHLPKFEAFEESIFVILRSADTAAVDSPDADTVQELTRKVAIFMGKGYFITVHRTEQPFLSGLLSKWRAKAGGDWPREHIFIDIVGDAVGTFEQPVLKCFGRLESIEEEILGAGHRRKFKMRDGYFLKRQISVYKRMLRASIEPLNQAMVGASRKALPHFQNARERIDGIYFNAEEISESVTSLLNLHVSLASQRTNEASQRTNEVMRVLTIFSCFFLPINFIASIYGMNLKNMPEANWDYGYYFVLGIMALVSLGIYFWFRRRGWMKGVRT